MGDSYMVGKYKSIKIDGFTKKVFVIEKYFSKLEDAWEFTKTDPELRTVMIS